MNIGPFQLLIIALVILVLFGRGRIAEMMGDFGKGIRNFKQGMSESDTPPAPPAQIDSQPSEPAPEVKSTDSSSQP